MSALALVHMHGLSYLCVHLHIISMRTYMYILPCMYCTIYYHVCTTPYIQPYMHHPYMYILPCMHYTIYTTMYALHHIYYHVCTTPYIHCVPYIIHTYRRCCRPVAVLRPMPSGAPKRRFSMHCLPLRNTPSTWPCATASIRYAMRNNNVMVWELIFIIGMNVMG